MKASAQRAIATISPAAPVAKPPKGFQVVQLPAIGAPWPGQGGTFVGIGRLKDAKRDHVLILPEVEKIDGTWQRALEYPKGLKIDGHADFEAPQREDGHLCQANVPHLFEKKAYWLAPQYADDERWAWFQYFYDGDQSNCHKDSELRLFAVRRFFI
jgi:hypothetical protein